MSILLEKSFGTSRLVVINNSIIEEKTEAIINPANENLIHGGGVAGLISSAGGPEIQKESREKAPVITGEATYTGSGTLPYRYIIHTVGPVWKGGESNEPELLRKAVNSALELGEQLKLKSVSIPAISTGIFNYPVKPAISTIFNCIMEFLKRGPEYLKTVHFCENDPQKAELIRDRILTIMPTELTENIMELNQEI